MPYAALRRRWSDAHIGLIYGARYSSSPTTAGMVHVRVASWHGVAYNASTHHNPIGMGCAHGIADRRLAAAGASIKMCASTHLRAEEREGGGRGVEGWSGEASLTLCANCKASAKRPPQRNSFTKFAFAFSYSMILSCSSVSTFFDALCLISSASIFSFF